MNPLWIVTSRDGPDLACETRGQAMEHCAIMAGDFPQCAPWNVTEYVPASDLAAAKAVAAEQALDEGLWCIAETAMEGHLQTALRRLAAAVEGDAAIAGSLPQKPAQDA